MAWIIENFGTIVLAIGSLIGFASVVVKLTPTPKDDEVVGKVGKVWNSILPVIEKVSLTSKAGK